MPRSSPLATGAGCCRWLIPPNPTITARRFELETVLIASNLAFIQTWPYPLVYLPLVVIYAVFSIAFSTWKLQSYFSTIPTELKEAAWIDGCTRLTSFTRVFLPLALPGSAIAAGFNFIYCWKSSCWPT